MVKTKRLYVLDIDGVLANIEHRMEHMRNKDYDKFYDGNLVAQDKKIDAFEPIYEQIRGMAWRDMEIVFVTGRPERLRPVTDLWIEHNWPMFSGKLYEMYMRKDHDYRPSPIVKQEMVEKYLDGKEFDEIVIVDDDPENVKAMSIVAYNANNRPTVTPITFGIFRLSGSGPSTSSEVTPDTDKSSQKSQRFAFRGLRSRRR